MEVFPLWYSTSLVHGTQYYWPSKAERDARKEITALQMQYICDQDIIIKVY